VPLPADAALKEAVDFLGDELLAYENLVRIYRTSVVPGCDPDAVFREALQTVKEKHIAAVKALLGIQGDPAAFSASELEAAVARFRTLKGIAVGRLDYMPAELHVHLLSHSGAGTVVAASEEAGRCSLWFIAPGTAEIAAYMARVEKELAKRHGAAAWVLPLLFG
jgi:hypothetical protein